MSTYHFSFGLNSPPNPGDIIQWDGTRWIPVPVPAAATPNLTQVLAQGNATGDNDIALTSTGGSRSIIGADETPTLLPVEVALNAGNASGDSGADGADAGMRAGQGHTASNGGAATVLAGDADQGNGGNALLHGGDTNSGTGGTALVDGGASDSGDGGAARLVGGESTDATGGNAILQAGESINGNGGEAQVNRAGGENVIRANDSGLAFWDGVEAERPIATDLASLGIALDAMGLITWSPA